MIDLPAKLQVFFQQHLNLLLLLLLLFVACTLLLPRVLYRRHIASNGKVELVKRFHSPVQQPGRDRQTPRYEALSSTKRRRLAWLFTLQLIILGLIVYGFGIALLDIALSGVAAGTHQFPEPFTLLCLLLGISCAITGVLIIYWRKKANPFHDQ